MAETLSLSLAVGLFAPVLVLTLAGRGLGFDPTLATVTAGHLELMVNTGTKAVLRDATQARIRGVTAEVKRDRSAARTVRPSLA
ncbi:hypothetical protein, partial [Vibrio vulnificus]|uniref:hypothetical protein n=1 Tax=Vibrio vulnificus TaxID=672 RepID=UPI0019D4A9D3